jgi:hypothetical protein
MQIFHLSFIFSFHSQPINIFFLVVLGLPCQTCQMSYLPVWCPIHTPPPLIDSTILFNNNKRQKVLYNAQYKVFPNSDISINLSFSQRTLWPKPLSCPPSVEKFDQVDEWHILKEWCYRVHICSLSSVCQICLLWQHYFNKSNSCTCKCIWRKKNWFWYSDITWYVLSY